MKRKSLRIIGQWVRQNAHIGMITGLLLLLAIILAPTLTQAANGDWPTYLSVPSHTGYNSSETAFNPSTAPSTKLQWTHTARGGISTQPIEANGNIYWGSWDGYEHATSLKNGLVWATFLGMTIDHNCSPSTVGVASTATIDTVTIGGVATSVDLVGGGDSNFYALNALTGKVIWHTSLGSSPSFFIWSSPTVYNGSVYIGVSSFGDCPLVQSKVVMMSESTGAIEHVFYTVPTGCTGNGVWGSPTIDPANGSVYIATGNPGSCGTTEIYGESVVQLHVSDLTVVSHWQVPASQQSFDTDFGDTPTFFTATINGVVTQMLGLGNKNGIYYAFNRNNITQGPVWEDTLAIGGACPQCGDGIIAPSAWDGQTLYAAGGITTINGKSCAGGLRALNPATGSFIWQHCMTGDTVLGAVTVVPGVIAVTEGTFLLLINATTGVTLFRFDDTNTGSLFYGSPSISNGVLYVGNMDGHLYSFIP